jgi:hypothetical protein
MSAADWELESYRVFTRRAPLVDEDHVLQWTNALWSDDSRYLPFATDSWVIAPDSVALELCVTTPHGCCGFPPCPSESGGGSKIYNGTSQKNQLCTCGELIGWHNTDCLLPRFIAFSVDDVVPLSP